VGVPSNKRLSPQRVDMGDQLSEVFWGMFITTMVGLLLGLARMAYKSKCKEVSCCCVKIVRDTDAEEKETELIMRTQPNNNNINNI
jgi:hypothetical protein